jgi:hypothetical protein
MGEDGRAARDDNKHTYMNTTSGKPRSNSKLHSLPPAHRATVDRWLFEENKSSREVARLCGQELKLPVGYASVLRYYHREKPTRTLREAAQTVAGSQPPGSAEHEFQGLLALARSMARVCATDENDPNKRRMFVDCLKLLISSRREGHEALRASTTREKFEFDAATACLLHQIEMVELSKDESVDDGQKILAIRQQLFGPNLPE